MERIYETMFIINPELEDEERESVVDTVKKTIVNRIGGKIESVDRWGIRNLAFKVRRFTSGDYTVILFRASPDKVNMLEDFYHVTPQIFRWQTFRRLDLEKKERKQMQKSMEEEKAGKMVEHGEDTEERKTKKAVRDEGKKKDAKVKN